MYWTLQAIAEPDNQFAAENTKQAISDLLSTRPYYNWNEKAKDYYITQTLKEHDRLCFFIEKETGQSAQDMSLYKFLATLENLEQISEQYGKH